MTWNNLRPGEKANPHPLGTDATLGFIGEIITPFASRDDCPKRGSKDGPLCELRLMPALLPALAGIEAFEELEILYWMHLARRDLLIQTPQHKGKGSGTFALRSPVRPNPIATSIVRLEQVMPWGLVVRGLDCVSGTPLLDIKPARSEFAPAAQPSAAESLSG